MPTMTYEDAEKRAQEAANNSIFLRLKGDKDKFSGLPVGQPFVYDQIWNTRTNQYEDFTPEHAARGDKPSPKFKSNFFIPAEKVCKIFEMNAATFADLMVARKKYGIKRFLEVQRHGVKGDTKTSYGILPEDSPKFDEFAAFFVEQNGCLMPSPNGGLKLHDLTEKDDETGAATAQTDMSSHDKKAANGTNGTAPQAPTTIGTGDVATKIITRLKLLSPNKLNEFLDKFTAPIGNPNRAVKFMKPSDLPAAEALLASWEAPPPAPAPAAVTEVDPFG